MSGGIGEHSHQPRTTDTVPGTFLIEASDFGAVRGALGLDAREAVFEHGVRGEERRNHEHDRADAAGCEYLGAQVAAPLRPGENIFGAKGLSASQRTL
jgi:hypothetical protein